MTSVKYPPLAICYRQLPCMKLCRLPSAWKRVNTLGCIGLLQIWSMVCRHDPRLWEPAKTEHPAAHPQREPLDNTVQPFAPPLPEVIPGFERGPPINTWSFGCLVLVIFSLAFMRLVHGIFPQGRILAFQLRYPS